MASADEVEGVLVQLGWGPWGDGMPSSWSAYPASFCIFQGLEKVKVLRRWLPDRGRSLGRACSEVGVEGRMFQGSAGSIGKMPSSGTLDGGGRKQAKHLLRLPSSSMIFSCWTDGPEISRLCCQIVCICTMLGNVPGKSWERQK